MRIATRPTGKSRERIITRKSGVWLLHNPSTNQGQAFDRKQRADLRQAVSLPFQMSNDLGKVAAMMAYLH